MNMYKVTLADRPALNDKILFVTEKDILYVVKAYNWEKIELAGKLFQEEHSISELLGDEK